MLLVTLVVRTVSVVDGTVNIYVSSWDERGGATDDQRRNIQLCVELNELRTVRHDDRCFLVVMTTASDVTRPPRSTHPRHVTSYRTNYLLVRPSSVAQGAISKTE